jgi:tetraacyldisaccharide 4'-kinase
VRAEAAVHRIWALPGGAAELLLWPLSLCAVLYGAGAAWRAAAYRRGLLRAEALPVPVISVGNLAVGGTGKTPLCIALARALEERGRRVGVLTRGYKGSHEGRGALLVSDGTRVLADAATAGDEAVLLARSLPGAPVAAGSRRAEAGRLLLAGDGFEAPDLLLLDDGFQHLALARDADVVLVDARAPLCNGRVLPRGPLRERPAALGRADVVVARGSEGDPVPDLSAHTAAPVLPGRTRVTGVLDAEGAPAGDLAGRSVLGVAGIARPERFAATLAELGVRLAGFEPRPDHAPYGPADAGKLSARARDLGAEAVATTAKDAVKLAPLWPEGGPPLRVVAVTLEVGEGGEGGDAWADGLLARAAARVAARAGGDGGARGV